MRALRKLRDRLLREEDGYAGTVIIVPGALLLVFIALQIALYYTGTTTAQSAAVAGYNQARAYGASDADGRAAAEQIVAGSGQLQDATVSIARTPTAVTVTVRGSSVSLIPGLTLPAVERTLTGPIERWVPSS